MRSQKTLKNIKFDLFITISIVLLGFFSRKIFIDSMGADVTGLMLLFVQLIGMINIAEMGVGTATASLLYKPLSNNDRPVIAKILHSAAKIYKFISAIVLLSGMVSGVVIYYTIPAVSEIQYSLVFWLIYVSNTAISYLFAHYVILFTADQKYYAARTIQGGSKIICTLLQLVVIVIFKNFFIYILCESVFLLIQYFLFIRKAKAEYDVFDAELIKVSEEKEEFKLVRNRIKNVFFHKIGGVLVFNTDYLIISKFLNLVSVTIYSSYMMIFQALAMFVNILGNSVTASVGNYLSHKNSVEKKELWNQILVLFFYVATCATALTFLTITDFVRLWIGNEYVLDKATLYVLLFNLFILISRVGIDIIKNASGEFSDIYLPIIEGGLNVTLSIILVNKMGFIGVIIGTALSNILIICLAKPIYLFKKIFHESILSFFISLFKPLMLAIISISIICFYPIFWTKADHFYDWAMKTAIASVAVFATVSFVFSISSEFRYITKKILTLLMKRYESNEN
ncbi:lipopolysaccharide biosynthesis protein [Scandinavium sp. NPDC088450]|uniref:lipopolysaccharide biosynthesis protein n=1 Tax=Scandinavium sp. NPDC088450 TaxID=3364514 RepID=UPI0038516DC1